MKFRAGMGACTFHRNGRTAGTVDDIPELGLPAVAQRRLRTIMSILDYEVSHNNVLGFYVDDVG